MDPKPFAEVAQGDLRGLIDLVRACSGRPRGVADSWLDVRVEVAITYLTRVVVPWDSIPSILKLCEELREAAGKRHAIASLADAAVRNLTRRLDRFALAKGGG